MKSSVRGPATLFRQVARWVGFVLTVLLGCQSHSARADDYGRLSLIEENDALAPGGYDRHYTQGALLAYLSPTLKPVDYAAALFDLASRNTPFFQPGPGVQRKFSLVVGQSIFTPTKFHQVPPDPHDRPFAGWLYTGGSLLQDTDGRMLEDFTLLGGVVGPDALGKEAQIWFHKLIHVSVKNLDQSWAYQLHNEPAFLASYERKWRYWQGSAFGLEADFIPEAGLTVGNVLTYGDLGATFRIGRNLGVDYGVAKIEPALSGTQWFDASRLEHDLGFYAFVGVQGRLVAHNIFLDGNSFTSSPSVRKEIAVGDASTGFSIFYRDWAKIDFALTIRSKEFTAQKGLDRYGTVVLTSRF